MPADLYYKLHIGVDGGSARVITAVTATSGIVPDEHLLARLVADHEGSTQRTVLDVIADTKYGTIDNYQWLEAREIRAAIPFGDANSDNRAIPRSAFAYDPPTGTYRCPHGAVLRRKGRTTTTAAHPLIIYRPHPRDCAACPLKERCCGKAKVRSISRTGRWRAPRPYHCLSGDLSSPRSDPAAQSLGRDDLRRRQRTAWTPPHRGRGLDNVRIQALLPATAQNVRQLALRRHAGQPSRGQRPSATAPATLPIPP